MPGDRWTEKEKDALRHQLAEEGRELADVELPDRSPHAIRSQAVRMGLIEQEVSRQKWTPRQVKRLKELQQEGFSASEIHEFELLGDPPRSLWAIRKMWGRMKLADQRRSKLMKKRKIWKPGEKREFDAYLRKHSRQQTPEEIGKQWGVARSTVARRQTELGLKVPRDKVLAMEYSQEKQRRARERIRRRNFRYWRERREERESELHELAEELRRKSVPEKECSECNRRWPKRSEFFHTREKRISIGKSRYFKHRCVLCENERRRKLQRRRK